MPTVVAKDDIDFVIAVMNSRDGEGLCGYVDRLTGKIILGSLDDHLVEFGDVGMDDIEAELNSRYLPIPKGGSQDAYQAMVEFIDTINDDHLADLLNVAIRGKGAFRRFKDVLRQAANESELERWYRFSEQQDYNRAVAWLAEVGMAVGE
jgi:hypothetical protein